eukprot:TRINITY_DN10816_c1_g1_i3.p1 TRINITY_DN10816_c1_g1~~TRINITY_DN10816_c1_g1_i3.p1  ORF type:complete len:299 (-),score=46.22 TRINITY_DN10816_c1_g1_i3:1658-2554(-)
MRKISGCEVSEQVELLISPSSELCDKYSALYSLGDVDSAAVQRGLVFALLDSSALFRHDVAFALGQRKQATAIPILTNVLKDLTEHPMVRHEAAEALGTIGTAECLIPLKQFVYDDQREVKETCELAIQRINYLTICEEFKNDAALLDPQMLPPYPVSLPLEKLAAIIKDETAKMLNRYRALFTIKGRNTCESKELLCEVLLSCESPLLQHEVAYIMGQIRCPSFVPTLQEVLQNTQQNSMVRQEAAEALGCIGSTACIELLQMFTEDSDCIVADECSVILSMLGYPPFSSSSSSSSL